LDNLDINRKKAVLGVPERHKLRFSLTSTEGPKLNFPYKGHHPIEPMDVGHYFTRPFPATRIIDHELPADIHMLMLDLSNNPHLPTEVIPIIAGYLDWSNKSLDARDPRPHESQTWRTRRPEAANLVLSGCSIEDIPGIQV
jgi:hypothetical protein